MSILAPFLFMRPMSLESAAKLTNAGGRPAHLAVHSHCVSQADDAYVLGVLSDDKIAQSHLTGLLKRRGIGSGMRGALASYGIYVAIRHERQARKIILFDAIRRGYRDSLVIDGPYQDVRHPWKEAVLRFGRSFRLSSLGKVPRPILFAMGTEDVIDSIGDPSQAGHWSTVIVRWYKRSYYDYSGEIKHGYEIMLTIKSSYKKSLVGKVIRLQVLHTGEVAQRRYVI